MNSYNFESVFQSIEQGIREIHESDQYREYLKVMTRFHSYSLNNIILIYQQNPDATFVAGYTAWQKKFSRQVRKGEKGIRILAPVSYRTTNPDTGEEQIKLGFRMASVFDVTQTEGKPLPEFRIPMLNGTIESFDKVMQVLRLVAPVPVYMKELPEPVHGYFSPHSGTIVLSENMTEIQTVKTLIHEIAHAMLHHLECLELCSRQKEIEAESVAYSVCQYFGIDTSDFSFPYLAVYSEKEGNLLKDSMCRIQEASSLIIRRINALCNGGCDYSQSEEESEQETEEILRWN